MSYKLYVVKDINLKPEGCAPLPQILGKDIDIIYLGLNDLCDHANLSGEELHHQLFLRGGIDIAARKLASFIDRPSFGIGFSAGGTALWKSTVFGASFTKIFCVSSTRLRSESSIIVANSVFFGGRDTNIPTEDWMKSVPDRCTIYEDALHNFYLNDQSDEMAHTFQEITQDIEFLSLPLRLQSP
ncbi:hypothetical protein [Thioclava sp. GXIMD4216]|uniref:hypothetical protein n=1 Tax=Thioclava sp. GXIMD4216 TaxID=3131929 RepID=UPI0030D5DDAE